MIHRNERQELDKMRQRNMLQMKEKQKTSGGGKKLNKMELSNILKKYILLFKFMVIKILTELRRR